jgi:two-component sensor histidine kinase
MRLLYASTWIKWPLVITVIAGLFILHGSHLVNKAHQLQSEIAGQVVLLDELSQLNDGLHQLGLVHRVDVNSRQYRWSGELSRIRTRVSNIQGGNSDAPVMNEMAANLELLLHRTDSLHREVMASSSDPVSRRTHDAVFHIILQRAQKTVDRSMRAVHEQGISTHATQLSDHWNEARTLLVAAGLLAVVLAWLAALSNRLLRESRVRSQQLDQARQKLEASHQELRETMLSKEEKEVMIKEIHHRVKNNLQIVKSLIRFQMDQVSDERTLELFNECVNRVSAMALVHEQTYLSKDLSNIEVDTYLQALIRDLAHAYAVGIELRMDVDIRVRTLGVDTLVPLGLLINEVISNSFKHAFKGRTQGTIVVHLSGNEGEGLMLRIGDDGVGLPERESWRTPKSLGMELIHTLAGQLDLTLNLADVPGTVYELLPEQQRLQRRA